MTFHRPSFHRFWLGIVAWLVLTPAGLLAQEELSLESLLDAPVSAATKYEQTAREAPSSVTVITSEDVEQYGFRTLAEVLESVGGIHISNDRRNAFVGVRGFGRTGEYNNRVLILLDGHALNETATGVGFIDSSLGSDLEMVERIEIVRGPGSALYGTGAMFAVINIVTKPVGVLNTGQATAEVGSLGHREGRAYLSHRFENGLEVVASGYGGRTEGADFQMDAFAGKSTTNGLAADLDWEEYYGAMTVLAYGNWRLQGSLASRYSADPTAPRQAAFGAEDMTILQQSGFTELSYSRSLNAALQLDGRAFLDVADQQSIYPYQMPLPTGGVMPFTVTEGGSSLAGGSEMRFRWDPTPSNRVIVGGEYRYSALHGDRVSSLQPAGQPMDARILIASAYIQDEYQLTPRLATTVGVRYDLNASSIDYVPEAAGYPEAATARRLHAVAPRAALVYRPLQRTTLKALYGKAFRAPNLYELYIQDPQVNFISNPHLDPEHIHTFELIWEQSVGANAAAGVTLYNYHVRGLIDRVFVLTEGTTRYENQSAQRATGVELSLQGRLDAGWRGEVQTAFRLDRKETVNAPRVLVKAQGVAPLGRWGTAGVLARYASSRLSHAGLVTDGYMLADVNLLSRRLWNHVQVGVRVRNVLDTPYWHPASLDHAQPFIEQDGRHVQIRAKVTL